MRTTTMRLAFLVMLFSTVPAGWGQTYGEQERGELAKALTEAKVPLERALRATARQGTPISAKSEVEDGKLQLSVYTMKDGTFSEVIVDHETAKIVKREPITQGEDFTAAKTQSQVYAFCQSRLCGGRRPARIQSRAPEAASAIRAQREHEAV